jgi:hypothetical protein
MTTGRGKKLYVTQLKDLCKKKTFHMNVKDDESVQKLQPLIDV